MKASNSKQSLFRALAKTNARDIIKKNLKSKYQSTPRDNLLQKNAANQPTQKTQNLRKAMVSRNLPKPNIATN